MARRGNVLSPGHDAKPESRPITTSTSNKGSAHYSRYRFIHLAGRGVVLTTDAVTKRSATRLSAAATRALDGGYIAFPTLLHTTSSCGEGYCLVKYVLKEYEVCCIYWEANRNPYLSQIPKIPLWHTYCGAVTAPKRTESELDVRWLIQQRPTVSIVQLVTGHPPMPGQPDAG